MLSFRKKSGLVRECAKEGRGKEVLDAPVGCDLLLDDINKVIVRLIRPWVYGIEYYDDSHHLE